MNSWIKSELAVPGRVISKLEDPETGTIENEWKVVWDTEPEMSESMLRKRARRYDVFGSITSKKATRKTTRSV